VSKSKDSNVAAWVIGVIGVVILVNAIKPDDGRTSESAVGGAPPNGAFRSAPSYADVSEEPITRDEAIAEHWDEIKDHLSGTVSLEACSSQSGNCYDLEAEIVSGTIETLHFPNGGYRSFSAEIESDGTASDIDADGNAWDFTVDLDSSEVDDAVREWASATGRRVD